MPTRSASSSNVQLHAVNKSSERIFEVPLAAIRRPLGKVRANDALKVEALMESIADIGLQEPIDVLLVDGKYYGFSGCHRFEVCCSVCMSSAATRCYSILSAMMMQCYKSH